jgi:predicted ArsR family transcriptional regulator
MARRKRSLVVRDAGQLRALRTPLRQEMVRTFSRLGACTVRELADVLGREPATLYYHVHALVDSGIVRETGKRKAGTRPESVYSLVAEKILIDRKETSGPFLSALSDLQRATLRAAEKELEAALKTRAPKKAGDAPILLRLASRLKPQQAARATKMLHELVEFIAENDDPEVGDTYSLTAAFVRLVK